jgi:hypothetical protein
MCHKIPSTIFRYAFLNNWVIKTFYRHTHNARSKYALAQNRDDLDHFQEVEVELWQQNDVQTWLYTTAEFLQLDNCQIKVDVPLWHVMTRADHYFDHNVVEKHLKMIFTDYKVAEYSMAAHTPSIIGDEKTAEILLPPKLRNFLSKIEL